ncbi:hypothetical protein FACS1894191_6520 [Clostridia bacterium]|nr:hypothetical protein FACS1894191_6520 [Clostridia bacterium]
MKRLFLIPIFLIPIFLSEKASAIEISEEKAGIISMTCGSIKLSLKNLQKSDVKSREALGKTYETVLTNFMKPLNIRLINNNHSAGALPSLQSIYSSEKDFFSWTFVDYSKSLESLIAYDCKTDPYGFYARLETVREKREAVRSSALRLVDNRNNYKEEVKTLESSL